MADADADSPTGPPLVQNWYRPWWKWAVAIPYAFVQLASGGSGPSPTTAAGTFGAILGIVALPVVFVFFATVIARALKRMRHGIQTASN